MPQIFLPKHQIVSGNRGLFSNFIIYNKNVMTNTKENYMHCEFSAQQVNGKVCWSTTHPKPKNRRNQLGEFMVQLFILGCVVLIPCTLASLSRRDNWLGIQKQTRKNHIMSEHSFVFGSNEIEVATLMSQSRVFAYHPIVPIDYVVLGQGRQLHHLFFV